MKFNKRVTKVLAIAVIAMFALTAIMIIPSAESNADSTIIATDGMNHTVTLEKPADHIVAIGRGASATVIQLGQVEKIVVTDKSTKTDSDSVYADLQKNIADGKVTATGSMYAIPEMKTDIVYAADTGKLNKETDVIILSGGGAEKTEKTYVELKDLGFKNILTWSSITNYNQIIDFVEAISKVITGGEAKEVKQMKNVRDTIKDTLDSKGVKEENKQKCFFVTWSSSKYMVGNVGSLGTALLVAAGGNVVSIDTSITKSTYDGLPAIVEKYGDEDIVIAADNSIIINEKVDGLKSQFKSEETVIVPMKPLWNNYSVDSMNGVWTLACAMYPEYFEGDVPELPSGGSNNNTIYYIIGGVVGAVVVIGIAVFLMKRK